MFFSLQWNGFIPNKVQLLFSYTKGGLKSNTMSYFVIILPKFVFCSKLKYLGHCHDDWTALGNLYYFMGLWQEELLPKQLFLCYIINWFIYLPFCHGVAKYKLYNKIFSNDKQTSCTYGSLFFISCDIRLGGVQKNKILRLIITEQTDSINTLYLSAEIVWNNSYRDVGL